MLPEKYPEIEKDVNRVLRKLFIGAVQPFASQNPPEGWLKANGAAVSRTEYAELFEAIGTTYGAGNGSTTFNLPDLRGEFIRGWDDGRGIDTGRTFGSSQSDEFEEHEHGSGSVRAVTDSTSTSGFVSPSGTHSTNVYQSGGSGNSRTYIITTENRGGDETRPRNVVMVYYIKH